MSQIKKINNRMEITPKPEKLGNVVAAERADEVVTLGQLNDYGVSGTTYKKYKANLLQTGIDAPVATVLENTFGGNITWTYRGVGAYSATSDALFTENKTAVLHGNQADMSTQYFIASTSEIQFNTYSEPAVQANGMMFTLTVEITVYN